MAQFSARKERKVIEIHQAPARQAVTLSPHLTTTERVVGGSFGMVASHIGEGISYGPSVRADADNASPYGHVLISLVPIDFSFCWQRFKLRIRPQVVAVVADRDCGALETLSQVCWAGVAHK